MIRDRPLPRPEISGHSSRVRFPPSLLPSPMLSTSPRSQVGMYARIMLSFDTGIARTMRSGTSFASSASTVACCSSRQSLSSADVPRPTGSVSSTPVVTSVPQRRAIAAATVLNLMEQHDRKLSDCARARASTEVVP